MGEFSVWHLLIVALVFLALFGYKKLPDAARSVGRSMRIFRAEVHEMRDEGSAAPPPPPPSPSTAAPTPRPAPSLTPTVYTGEALPPATAPHPDTVPPRSEPVTGGDA
ncbi:MAG TPA: Sec-independent protein translocase subunit TatA [Mycobacteriales bacterium]|nr:Sec-independent protein translocase subunit TatA [Mycobacteriales bacterium]